VLYVVGRGGKVGVGGGVWVLGGCVVVGLRCFVVYGWEQVG